MVMAWMAALAVSASRTNLMVPVAGSNRVRAIGRWVPLPGGPGSGEPGAVLKALAEL
jgi:hypothetical protein